jgi:vacuolar-type H+-ATPase subunit I/STV1
LRTFTQIYTEQVKKLGRTIEAVQSTIKICKDQNILKEYLETREKEAVDIMTELYNYEKIFDLFVEEKKRETAEEAAKEAAKEAAEKTEKETKITVFNLAEAGMPRDQIAKVIRVNINTVNQWLDKEKTAI